MRASLNEFLLEGDNITVSGTTFPVALAPYPNLVAENLNIAGPDSNRVYTATWTTANRGTAPAPAGFKERFFVRNLTSGVILTNSESTIGSAEAVRLKNVIGVKVALSFIGTISANSRSNDHDSQIGLGRISALFAEEKSQDQKAPQFGHVFIPCGCGKARTRRAVFQAGLEAS